MKKLKCHCGAIEAQINIQGNLEKFLHVQLLTLQKKRRSNVYG